MNSDFIRTQSHQIRDNRIQQLAEALKINNVSYFTRKSFWEKYLNLSNRWWFVFSEKIFNNWLFLLTQSEKWNFEFALDYFRSKWNCFEYFSTDKYWEISKKEEKNIWNLWMTCNHKRTTRSCRVLLLISSVRSRRTRLIFRYLTISRALRTDSIDEYFC